MLILARCSYPWKQYNFGLPPPPVIFNRKKDSAAFPGKFPMNLVSTNVATFFRAKESPFCGSQFKMADKGHTKNYKKIYNL